MRRGRLCRLLIMNEGLRGYESVEFTHDEKFGFSMI